MSEQVEKIEIEKKQLADLLEWNQQLQDTVNQKDEEIKALYFGVMKVTDLLGISENAVIKPSMKEKGVNPLPEIIKSAGGLFALVMQSGIPGIGIKAKAQLTEKFGFFADLMPLFERYEKQFGKTENIKTAE